MDSTPTDSGTPQTASYLRRDVGAWRVVLAPHSDQHPLTLNEAAAAVLDNPLAPDADRPTRDALAANGLLTSGPTTSEVATTTATSTTAQFRPPATIVPAADWESLVAHLLTFATPFGADARLDITAWTEGAWSDAIERMRTGALIGLCHRAIRDGWIIASDEQCEPAEGLLLAISTRALMVERALLRAVHALEAAGLTATVLKGCATAHLDHPVPTDRQFGDADVLVADSSFGDIAAALATVDMRAEFNVDRAGPALKAVSYVDGHGVAVDVHQHLADGVYGTMAMPAPDRRESFVLGGTRLQALDGSQRLAHAILHARPDIPMPAKVGTLRDLACRPFTNGDAEQLRAWGMISITRKTADHLAPAAPAVATAITSAVTDQPVSTLDRVAAATPRRSIRGELLTTLRQPTALQAISYARARILPGRAFRASLARASRTL